MNIWIARKKDGKLISLTEKEAIIHFKNNNIASRMQLDFIGTSNGSQYIEKKKQLLEENKDKLVYDFDRPQPPEVMNLLDDIEQQALEAEAEVAKANGMTQPDRGIDVQVKGVGVGEDTLAKARRNLGNLAR